MGTALARGGTSEHHPCLGGGCEVFLAVEPKRRFLCLCMEQKDTSLSFLLL